MYQLHTYYFQLVTTFKIENLIIFTALKGDDKKKKLKSINLSLRP